MIGFKSTNEKITGKYADAIRKAATESDSPVYHQRKSSGPLILKTERHTITWKEK